MTEEMPGKLSLWELREVIGNDGFCEYIITDYQRINFEQPTLSIAREKDGNIYAFVETCESVICLCRIESKEQLIKLKRSLVGFS